MPETASSSTHWSNKRNKNLKGEDVIAAEEEEAIIVADHAPIINNKTSNEFLSSPRRNSIVETRNILRKNGWTNT